MLSQNQFLQAYNILPADFEKTNLIWKDLVAMHDDFIGYKEELEPSAILIFNRLMKADKIHSVRYRVKDPEHLIDKIIRKKIESPDSNITFENYRENVTDLIGLRALHLFKEDWLAINDFINSNWEFREPPVANFRKGDSEEIINFFKKNGWEPKEHKFGYRSIHYIIEIQPGRHKHYAEIQVRTIFEEAWAEIDHTIRYPYDINNPMLFQFLSILNRFAGGADEMGSFIKFLQKELERKEDDYSKQMSQKDKLIASLEKKLEKPHLGRTEVEKMKKGLEKLKSQPLANYYKSLQSFSKPAGLKSIFDSNLLGWNEHINPFIHYPTTTRTTLITHGLRELAEKDHATEVPIKKPLPKKEVKIKKPKKNKEQISRSRKKTPKKK